MNGRMKSSRLCLLLALLLVGMLVILHKGFHLWHTYNSPDNSKTWVKTPDELVVELQQKERKEHLNKFCESYKRKSTKLSSTVLSHLMVFDKYKTLYCYVPKVGTTQWKTVLYTALHGHAEDEIHPPRLHTFLYQYSDEEIQLRLKTYFKFVFVREPFERLLSAYEDKFVKRIWAPNRLRRFEKEIIKSHKREDPKADDTITFPTFISYVAGDGHESDDHWTSYEGLCDPCAVQYDFIGHLDKMGTEGPYVLKETGMDEIVTFPTVYPHNTSTKLLDKYSEVPNSTIFNLRNALQTDFEMFNYSFPGPLSDLP